MRMQSEIELPYPPSLNTYWRNVRGRTLLSKKGREYRAIVTSLAALSKIRLGDVPLVVSIEAWMPDRRRRDVDNILKAAIDAMQHGGMYDDDSQIVDLRIVKRGVEKPGKLIVKLAAA